MSTRIAFAALLINAILCAGWAERVDTFLITTAILTAALIVALRNEDIHGETDHHGRGNAGGDHP